MLSFVSRRLGNADFPDDLLLSRREDEVLNPNGNDDFWT